MVSSIHQRDILQFTNDLWLILVLGAVNMVISDLLVLCSNKLQSRKAINSLLTCCIYIQVVSKNKDFTSIKISLCKYHMLYHSKKKVITCVALFYFCHFLDHFSISHFYHIIYYIHNICFLYAQLKITLSELHTKKKFLDPHYSYSIKNYISPIFFEYIHRSFSFYC
jgi:hypothetical protein